MLKLFLSLDELKRELVALSFGSEICIFIFEASAGFGLCGAKAFWDVTGEFVTLRLGTAIRRFIFEPLSGFKVSCTG